MQNDPKSTGKILRLFGVGPCQCARALKELQKVSSMPLY